MSFGFSLQGQENDINGDRFYAGSEEALFIVSDGVGSARGGEVASRLAVDSVEAALREAEAPGDIKALLLAAARKAHDTVRTKAAADARLKKMRATLCFLYVRDGSFYFCNVGDSRGYLIRGKAAYQVTNDHTPAWSLVREGAIKKENLSFHPDSHILLQAIGSSRPVNPEIQRADLRRGDIFLICSDGLSNTLEDQVIADIVAGSPLPGYAAKKLAEAAAANGETDDITAVVAYSYAC